MAARKKKKRARRKPKRKARGKRRAARRRKPARKKRARKVRRRAKPRRRKARKRKARRKPARKKRARKVRRRKARARRRKKPARHGPKRKPPRKRAGAPKPEKPKKITAFDFKVGRILANKYEVVSRLGVGWEGEVYLIREVSTGIERTAKFFFPHRNLKNRTLTTYAKKLHKLEQCPMVIRYHSQERMKFEGVEVSALISEYVRGEILSEFLKKQPGGRLGPFQALHLLHALASGMEAIHRLNEYHGDIHSDNIIVQSFGLGFELKLIDFFQWSAPRKENIRDDVVNMIQVFHEALGGPEKYTNLPPEVKDICCGLRSSLIFQKFRSAGQLKTYLENMRWSF